MNKFHSTVNTHSRLSSTNKQPTIRYTKPPIKNTINLKLSFWNKKESTQTMKVYNLTSKASANKNIYS